MANQKPEKSGKDSDSTDKDNRSSSGSTLGGAMCEAELLLNIKLEYKVNKSCAIPTVLLVSVAALEDKVAQTDVAHKT